MIFECIIFMMLCRDIQRDKAKQQYTITKAHNIPSKQRITTVKLETITIK